MDIDFVILWVDGNDPAWLEEKNIYQSQKKDDSNTVNRYRDWNLLPYWYTRSRVTLGAEDSFCDMGACSGVF